MAGPMETRKQNQRHLIKKVKPLPAKQNTACQFMALGLRESILRYKTVPLKIPFLCLLGITLCWFKKQLKGFKRYKEKCTNLGLPGNGYVPERGDQLTCSGRCFQLKASHPSEAIYLPTEQRHWWTGAPSTLPGGVTPSPASPSPPSSFQHLLTIQATQVAFHSAVSFRSFKRSPDRLEAWICLSELKKKKKIFFLSGSDQTDGYCLPWRQMQNNAFGEKMTTPQKGCQTSMEVTEEGGGSKEVAS